MLDSSPEKPKICTIVVITAMNDKIQWLIRRFPASNLTHTIGFEELLSLRPTNKFFATK